MNTTPGGDALVERGDVLGAAGWLSSDSLVLGVGGDGAWVVVAEDVASSSITPASGEHADHQTDRDRAAEEGDEGAHSPPMRARVVDAYLKISVLFCDSYVRIRLSLR